MAQFTLDGITYSRFRDIPGAVYTRSGVEYQQNAAGVWTPFDDDVPPISSGVGVDAWEARTNSIPNPTFLGTSGSKSGSNAAGILGSVPSRMSIRNDAPGVTITVVGTGVEFGLPYMDLDFAGTVPLNSTWFRLFWEAASQISASNAQTWTQVFFTRVISGSMSGFASSVAYADLFDGGGYAGTINFASILSSFVSSATPVKAGGQTTIGVATTTGMQPYITFASTAAVPIAVRIRFYAPNLKLGADINDPPILQTTNAAATRGNPSMYINAPGLLVPPFAVVARFKTANAVAASEFRRVFSINDGTTANLCDVYLNSGQVVRALSLTGGVQQADFGSRTFSPGALAKVAVRLKTDSIGISVNGLAVESDNSATLAAQYPRIQFGDNAENLPNRKLNGAITRFQIINRDVSDAELVALTA